MDISKRTVLHGALLGFLCCVIASVAIGASVRLEHDLIKRISIATGSAFFFISPAAIAFYIARTSRSARPFLAGLLGGSLGGSAYSVLVTVLVFGGGAGSAISSVGFTIVPAAVGALLGLLVGRRDVP